MVPVVQSVARAFDIGSCMHGLASLDAPVWFDSVCAGGRTREKVTLCPG